MPFRVDQGDHDRAFRLVGELDLATVQTLVDRLRPVAEDAGDVELDASGLTFIDSSGLHGLVTIARNLSGHGRLIIQHAEPFMRNVLAITGLDRQDVFLLSED
jgi:anti-sigma B factor antagonist